MGQKEGERAETPKSGKINGFRTVDPAESRTKTGLRNESGTKRGRAEQSIGKPVKSMVSGWSHKRKVGQKQGWTMKLGQKEGLMMKMPES